MGEKVVSGGDGAEGAKIGPSGEATKDHFDNKGNLCPDTSITIPQNLHTIDTNITIPPDILMNPQSENGSFMQD